MNEQLITRPMEHVEKLIGRRPVLVYGDLKDGNIIFYSNRQFPGYYKEGSLFSRKVSLSDLAIENKFGLLTEARAYVYPKQFNGKIITEPDEDLRRLFGVDDSFGYAPSNDFMNNSCIDDDDIQILPSDIFLAHEGAHFVPEKIINESILPKYGRFIPDSATAIFCNKNEFIRQTLSESIALLSEFSYLQKFHPEMEDCYRDWRMTASFCYEEAYRLLREESSVLNDMAADIRMLQEKSDSSN